MVKRVFDIIFSLALLLLLLPVLLFLGLGVALTSPGGVFFRQVRVGKDGREFRLLKFRTMRTGTERQGQITIGDRDPRVTSAGYWLRKTKLDELPQLWNVLMGDMSVVGPRPEVPKYVALYSLEQREVLSVRPGITGMASMNYIDENELLLRAADPQRAYVEQVMPAKIELDRRYVRERSFVLDLRIIARTLHRIFFGWH